MQPVTTDRPWPLHDSASSRLIESDALAATASHALMQSAGRAVARLGMSLAPHAQTIWIACGPGNNGGDGLEAAIQLHAWGKRVMVHWLGNAQRQTSDAALSWQRAQAAGVQFVGAVLPELTKQDLCIDALLGLGGSRAPHGAIATTISAINASAAIVLAVDLPSGLDADTGEDMGGVHADHTLSLLTLKPGLFTNHGRDLSGQVWLDDLAARTSRIPPGAWLSCPPSLRARSHASHKGSFGDVTVIGGAPGMRGAAILAATAALHAGAGRVHVALLDAVLACTSLHPAELMARDIRTLSLHEQTVVCGCGGGPLIADVLPRVLDESARLVLDADALNAVAGDPSLKSQLRARTRPTVVTPHPLEAARLLGCSTSEVQGNRLLATRQLVDQLGAVVVLKGSGTVIAAPGEPARINPTGNARLATAGTGDVLAGMVAARLAAGMPAVEAACAAVFRHGQAADRWPLDQALTASALARAAGA